MDWASEEWKQALTPLAAQKVHLLEDRIELLKKERTQKQLQFECLELALEKEKRKTEKEKQNVADIQRELQSLADSCKDYESKHQKLQNELQNKESRIKNLETLLAQTRKENSKLQINLKDLSCAQQNCKSIQEQKLQKKLQEQSFNKSLNEDSSINGDNANEQIVNSFSDNSKIESSLKQKIEEQEELIKELKLKLASVPRNDDALVSSVFKTPAKAMPLTVTDSPAVNSKSTWGAFSSTPAKGNKDKMLGHESSNSIDSGNEKIESLQLRLKQLCQEMDCQRFNFEASKNALELKYKESEATLKEDLKFQQQANAELDKELKDSRNKFQQEITQTTKKLDLLTLQLKKSEESKITYERDLKSLESKINMNESQLRAKEVELQELQKSKKESENMQQSLQSKIRELEKNCKALTEEKTLLKENVRAIEMQLEGSNNLVKEKETNLHNVQQLLNSLQLRWNELENHFTMQQATLKDTQANEAAVKEQLQITINEKKELSDSLNSEIQRNKEKESSITDFKQKVTFLEEDLTRKESFISEFRSQIQLLEDEYQKKIQELADALSLSNTTVQSLESEINTISSNENNLKEKLKVLDQEKLELHQLMLEASKFQENLENKCQDLEKEIKMLKEEHEKQIQLVNESLKASEEQINSLESELSKLSSEENNLKEKLKVIDQEKLEINNQLILKASKVRDLELDIIKEKENCSLIQEDLEKKCLNLEELIKITKEDHERQIEEVNHALKSSKDKVQYLECELRELSSNNANLTEKLEIMEQEKIALSNHIMSETSKAQKLELSIEQESQKLQRKCIEFEEYIKDLKEEHQTSKHKLEQELKEMSLKEATISEKLGEMWGLNKLLSEDIDTEKNTTKNLNLKIEEEALKSFTLKKELASKTTELGELHSVMKLSKSQFEIQIQELNNAINLSEAKIADLERELSDISSNDKDMKEKLNLLEQEKQELSNQFKLNMSEVQQLKMCIKKEKEESSILREEFNQKCGELELHSNKVKSLEDAVKGFEIDNRDLERKLEASEKSLGLLKDQLHEKSLEGVSLNEKVMQMEGSNRELSEVLSLECNKINCLKLELEERSQKVSALEELLASKSSELEDLENQLEVSTNELKDKIITLEKEIDSYLSNEYSIEQKLVLVEEEKLKLSNDINLKVTEIQLLEQQMEKEKEDKSFLTQQLENNSIELEKLKNQVKVLKEFKSKNKDADQKLHAAIEQLGKLQNQLHKSSLTEISLQEEIKQLERMNNDLSENLNNERKNTEHLELKLQEESQKLLSFEKDFSSKSLQLVQYEQEMLNLRSQLEVTEMKLKSTEQEKFDISEQLKLDTVELQDLKSELESEKTTSSSLKEKVASYYKQIQELSKQMKNLCAVYEVKVKDLQAKFSSVESKSMALENQFKEHSFYKTSSEERICIAEKDKVDLLNQLTIAENKIQKLELSIEEEQKTSFKLGEEIAYYCQEFEKLNNQFKILNEVYQEKMLELEARFSSAEAKSLTLETQLKELSSNKTALDETLGLVENDNNELLSQLASAASKIEELEKILEKEKGAFSVLKEEMDIKCIKVEELDSQMEIIRKEYEITLQALEDKLNLTLQELSTSQKQLLQSSTMEISLKEKIEELEKQNQGVLNNFLNEVEKSKSFQEESQKISSLHEELSLKSSEIEELENQVQNSKNQYEDEIGSLQHALSLSKSKIASLETEIEVSTLNEDEINEKLKQVIQENSELSHQLNSKADKLQELESKVETDNETLSHLKKELEIKSLEIDNLHQQLEDHKGKIQTLEDQLYSSEMKITSLEHELTATTSKENSLAEEFKRIMQENSEISKSLNIETDNVQQLESCIEVEKEASIFLKEKLETKCQELEALGCQIEMMKDEKEDKIKKLENELRLAQSEYTVLKQTMEESSLDASELKQQLDALVKEKGDLTCQLTEITNQCSQKEITVQELQGQIKKLQSELAEVQSDYTILKEKENSSFNEIDLKQHLDNLGKDKEDLSNRVMEATNKNMQLETTTQEQQVKIKSLENELALAQSEYTALKQTMEKSSLDARELKQELDTLVKEKGDLTSQITEITSKCMLNEIAAQKLQDQIKKLENELAEVQSDYALLKEEKEKSSLNEIELKQQLDNLVKEKEYLSTQVVKAADKNMQLQTTTQEQQGQINKLENELEQAMSKYETLKPEMGESSLSENELKEQLDALVKENEDLTSQITEITNKYQQLDTSTEEQQDQINKLENELALALSKYETLKQERGEFSLNEIELKQQLDDLVKEKEDLTSQVTEVADRYQQLETSAQEQQIKIQDLENKLSTTQNELQSCSSREQSLVANLTLLGKENEEANEKINLEFEKSEKLQLLVQELSKSCASFEQELSNKTTLLEEAKSMAKDFQVQIHNLENNLATNQGDFEKLLQECSMNEKNLNNSYSALKIQCLETSNELAAEILKTEKLEILVEELKLSYTSIKEKLNEVNKQKVALQPKKTSSESVSFGYSVAHTAEEEIQMCKEVEHSQTIHKISVGILEKILVLEEDLITKANLLKFLFCYNLIEKNEKSCLLKKFMAITKRFQLVQYLKKLVDCIAKILKINAVSCQIDMENTNVENALLETFYFPIQKIFYLSGDNLNKFLFSISQILQQNKMEIKRISMNKYKSVNTNKITVILDTKFLIRLHQLNKTFFDSQLILRKQNQDLKIYAGRVEKALKVIKVQDLPYFLNYAVTVTECIDNICGTYSNLSLNALNLAELSSPLLHLAKQYLSNCLDSVRILKECNYWKQHHTILGLSESNIERVASMFKCKFSDNSTISETAKEASMDVDFFNLDILSETAKDQSIDENTLNHSMSPETATDPSIDMNLLKEELIAYQKALSSEKEKQVMLNATIEEIERDLGETFQQKERYVKMVLEISKVLARLKESISTDSAFNMIALAELSSEYCYCEMCVLQEEIDLSKHDELNFPDIFTYFKKFDNQINSKLLLNQQEDLNTLCKDLQDRNSELAIDVVNSNVASKDTHDEIEKLRYELMKEKNNYRQLYETVDEKDNMILELESFNINLSIENEQFQVKVDSCEEEICKLSEELKHLKAELLSKQSEIDTLQNFSIDASMLEELTLQCKEYDSKIQLLNSTISKYEEEKALDKHLSSATDIKNQNTISKLQDEIKNLKKINDALNLTVETIEDELKTVYSEKQNSEELEKLTMQNVQLREEVLNANKNYISEQLACEKLLSDIKKYEALSISSDNTIKELRKRIESLDKDIGLYKGTLGDHAEVIYKNNSSLKLKDQMIDCLNKQISELEQENVDLNMQLEKNISTDNPLQLRLSKLTEQCSQYEGELKRLQLVETDNIKLLEKINEVELQRDDLLKDAGLLRETLENVSEQLIHYETKHEELTFTFKETYDALNEEIALKSTLEEEINGNKNVVKELENQIQTLNLTLEEFKIDTIKTKEDNLVLVNKVEDQKCKIEELSNSLEGAFQKQRSLLVDNEELIAKLKQAQSLANKTSEMHNLRGVLTSAHRFITNILDVTIHLVKNYPEAHNLCSNLLSALEYWKQCSKTEPKTGVSFNGLFEDLKHFYESCMKKPAEEQAIRDQVASIIYSLNNFGEFCELSAQKYKTSNSADVTNMSMFETTVGNFIDVAYTKSSSTNLVLELQQVKKILDELFGIVKYTVNKQAEEIEKLERRLIEVSFTQVPSYTEPTSKMSLETKCNMYKINYRKLSKEYQQSKECQHDLKELVETLHKEKHSLEVNYQKLEKEHHDFQKTYHEMKGHIETLQKEKQDLEEEAEELAADIKKMEDQLLNSNELAETLTKLVKTQQKLKNSENEIDWLKKKLEKMLERMEVISFLPNKPPGIWKEGKSSYTRT
ncbi:hypothetical protein JTE90_000181 [Oedothorax gibbosus]|uniref:Centromere protein F n=1 Tax=Oedothorax gibbosus TaxID=931172 RepID=A0AAV6UW74_9ARAC|nr:hypothetical protein JTE90_000181 [Oedothorax gibbosus]